MRQDRIAALLRQDGRPGLRETFGAVMLLAWPAILEQIMITAVQYVDTAMVGQLGASATAARGPHVQQHLAVQRTVRRGVRGLFRAGGPVPGSGQGKLRPAGDGPEPALYPAVWRFHRRFGGWGCPSRCPAGWELPRMWLGMRGGISASLP